MGPDSPGGRRDLEKNATEDNTNICDFVMPPILCAILASLFLSSALAKAEVSLRVVGVHDGDTIAKKFEWK